MEIDIKFAEKLRNKDESAVKIFVNEFKTPLYNYIYRIVENRTDAEDILQEVFFKFFKVIKRINFSKNYRAFIFKIARNACFDFIRKNIRYKFIELKEETEGKEEAFFDRMEKEKKIEQLLQRISTEDREIILLKYIENFKISEISEILGIPESTIKVKITRALKKMREFIN